MSSKLSRAEIQKELINIFSEIGCLFELNKLDILCYNSNITSIYLSNKNAIEIEIDWRENILFMYVVRLIDKKIPDDVTVYKYDDGSWCRKYIDEVYNTKNPLYESSNRTNPDFLIDLLLYYQKLIYSSPDNLRPFLGTH